ncbi:MAG: hypothetical protein AAFN93_01190 [Bacteroidota bacterium]
MNLSRLVSMFILISFIVSCNEDEEPSNSLQGGPFLPLVEGNQWEYEGDVSYTLRITGNTREIDGKNYAEAETKTNGQITNSYLNVENGEYFAVGFLSSTEVSLILLKENEGIGATWQTSGNINGINAVYKFSIEEKGIEHTVSGEKFDDVVRVKLDTIIQLFGVEEVVGSQDIYFARGVGIIEIDLGALGNASLVDYTIN